MLTSIIYNRLQKFLKYKITFKIGNRLMVFFGLLKVYWSVMEFVILYVCSSETLTRRRHLRPEFGPKSIPRRTPWWPQDLFPLPSALQPWCTGVPGLQLFLNFALLCWLVLMV